MNNNISNRASFESILATKIDLPQDIYFCYGCCGNCRFYDGDGWCGYHRTSTSGGDHCSCWEE